MLSGAPGAAAGNFEKPVALDSNRSETQPVSGRPSFKFRILKNHRAETRREIRGFPCESSKILGERPGPFPLTLGKVDTSASTRNSRVETTVAGWGARIRTWKWRNHSP